MNLTVGHPLTTGFGGTHGHSDIHQEGKYLAERVRLEKPPDITDFSSKSIQLD